MTLFEIQNSLSSVTDWEDSYLTDGSQRLLGKTEKYTAEIILGKEIISLSFYFNSVDMEITSALGLVLGSIRDSLRFLKDAATFVASNPNTHYQESFVGYNAKMILIKNSDSIINYLVVERVRGLRHP